MDAALLEPIFKEGESDADLTCEYLMDENHIAEVRRLALALEALTKELERFEKRIEKFDEQLENIRNSDASEMVSVAVLNNRVDTLEKVVYGLLAAVGVETIALAVSLVKWIVTRT